MAVELKSPIEATPKIGYAIVIGKQVDGRPNEVKVDGITARSTRFLPEYKGSSSTYGMNDASINLSEALRTLDRSERTSDVLVGFAYEGPIKVIQQPNGGGIDISGPARKIMDPLILAQNPTILYLDPEGKSKPLIEAARDLEALAYLTHPSSKEVEQQQSRARALLELLELYRVRH